MVAKSLFLKNFTSSSSFLVNDDTKDLKYVLPHIFSNTLDNFLVDTPWTHISIMVASSTFSFLWYLSKTSVENLPSLVLGTLRIKVPKFVV